MKKETLIIDIESKPYVYFGVYNATKKEYRDYNLKEFRSALPNLMKHPWVLHNWNGYDKFIMNYVKKNNPTEEEVGEYSDMIINTDHNEKVYWPFNIVVDSMSYVKKSLKDYAIEHDLPTQKFDFENNTNLQDLRDYLKEDVMATYHLFTNYVIKELKNTKMAWETAGFKINQKSVYSNYQSGRVVANELIGNDTSGVINGNYDINYKDLDNIKEANKWFKKIYWKNEKYVNYEGNKELIFNWKDNEFALGFGGIHSHNEKQEFKDNLYHLDISSYYPHLIKMLLKEEYGIRATISDGYFHVMDTRLELKRKGDSSNNSLKLFINSIYGLLWAKGYETKIHNPLLQVMVCLTGQYQILNLLDMITNVGIDYKIVQTNTDGIIIQTKEIDKVDNVRNEWEVLNKNYLTFDVDPVDYYYGEDVNNYFMKYPNGVVKAKGRFKYSYNVNTKYDELRHNLALNKIFINHKLGEDILKIEEKDYSITPNNKTKAKYGSSRMYLNRNGHPFINKNHDTTHAPNGNVILVGDTIDYEYYKALATPYKFSDDALKDIKKEPMETFDGHGIITEPYGIKGKIKYGFDSIYCQNIKLKNQKELVVIEPIGDKPDWISGLYIGNNKWVMKVNDTKRFGINDCDGVNVYHNKGKHFVTEVTGELETIPFEIEQKIRWCS